MRSIYGNKNGYPLLVVQVDIKHKTGFVENGHWDIKFLDDSCQVGICKEYPKNDKIYFIISQYDLKR